MNASQEFEVNVQPSCKQYWNQCYNQCNNICNSSHGHGESLFVLRHWSWINFKHGKLSCPLMAENYRIFSLAMKTSSAAIWNSLITFIRFYQNFRKSLIFWSSLSNPSLNFPALGGGITDRRFDDFRSPILRWVLSLITLFKFENGFDFRISNSKKVLQIIQMALVSPSIYKPSLNFLESDTPAQDQIMCWLLNSNLLYNIQLVQCDRGEINWTKLHGPPVKLKLESFIGPFRCMFFNSHGIWS